MDAVMRRDTEAVECLVEEGAELNPANAEVEP